MESVRSIFERNTKKIENLIFLSCCFGCTIESNENEFSFISGHIAIEWEASAYFLQYLPSREQVNRERMLLLLFFSRKIGCRNSFEYYFISTIKQ